MVTMEEWIENVGEGWLAYCGPDEEAYFWKARTVSVCLSSTLFAAVQVVFILYSWLRLAKLYGRYRRRRRYLRAGAAAGCWRRYVGVEALSMLLVMVTVAAWWLLEGPSDAVASDTVRSSTTALAWLCCAVLFRAEAVCAAQHGFAVRLWLMTYVCWLSALELSGPFQRLGIGSGLGVLFGIGGVGGGGGTTPANAPGLTVADAFFLADYVLSLAVLLLSLLPLFPSRPDATSHGNLDDPYVELLESASQGLDRDQCDEDRASLLSKATFGWVTPLLKLGADMTTEDVRATTALPERYSAAASIASLERSLQRPTAKKGASKRTTKVTVDEGREYHAVAKDGLAGATGTVRRAPHAPCGPLTRGALLVALVRSFGWTMFLAGVFSLVQLLVAFAAPFFLKLFMRFTDSSQPALLGLVYVFGMFASKVVESLSSHQYQYLCWVVGMQVRCSMSSVVFEKGLWLGAGVRAEYTVGRIVNLLSVDVQKLADACPNFHYVWSLPLQIVIAMVLLYDSVGLSLFAGVAVMLCGMGANYFLAKWMGTIQARTMREKDHRMRHMTASVTAARTIKMMGLETFVMGPLQKARADELLRVRGYLYASGVSVFMNAVIPILVSVGTFVCYTQTGHKLTPESAFTALTIFRLLQTPLSFLPTALSSVVQAAVSMGRLVSFLGVQDLRELQLDDGPFESSASTAGSDRRAPAPAREARMPAVAIDNASFHWVASQEPAVQIDCLRIPAGALVVILGPVGSGKTSLLSAVLGDVHRSKGWMAVSGKIAYCPQQAWIQNATVRDNILFGLEYNERKYKATLSVCALERDLALLQHGDDTEIGERGANLSGGQKQRIALARAVYSDRDVYMLDDTLSALDASVGQQVFDQCIKGHLSAKTRLLVTHDQRFLPHADHIVHVQEGRASSFASYQEFVDQAGAVSGHNERQSGRDGTGVDATADGAVVQGGNEDPTGHIEAPVVTAKDTLKSPSTPILAAKAKSFVVAEGKEVGRVGWSVYGRYLRAGGGVVTITIVVLAAGMWQLCQVASDWTLLLWTNANKADKALNELVQLKYLGLYGGLAVLGGLFTLGRTLTVATGGVRAAARLHQWFVTGILSSPMLFFDTTPVGRVLNRASADVGAVDQLVPFPFGSMMTHIMTLTGIVVVTLLVTPGALLPLFPIAVVYVKLQQYYLATSRELTRFDAMSKSPVLALLTESLQGVTVVRAFGGGARFLAENTRRLEANCLAYFPSFVVTRWVSVRLEFIAACFLAISSLFAVVSRDSLDAGLVGLSLTYSLSLSDTMRWLVMVLANLENQMVSVERVLQYADLPREEIEHPSRAVVAHPPEQWPQQGGIKFDDVSLRYRPEDPCILSQLSFTVNPGEKVAIVGRTGAGKSSLGTALFRLVDPYSGKITLDGIDITAISLEDLRSKLSIVPQDPVLFVGSVRRNVDPINRSTDADVWCALRQVGLEEHVRGLDGALLADVSENGDNFSVGQRQMMCIARALIRNSKVLVLDEATANVDQVTDMLIQDTVRKAFRKCTVLCIAHRVQTVLDYDRVLVMESGRVVESDTPAALMRNPQSHFTLLVRQSSAVPDASQ